MRAREILGFVLLSMMFITIFLGTSACGDGSSGGNKFDPATTEGLLFLHMEQNAGIIPDGSQQQGAVAGSFGS